MCLAHSAHNGVTTSHQYTNFIDFSKKMSPPAAGAYPQTPMCLPLYAFLDPPLIVVPYFLGLSQGPCKMDWPHLTGWSKVQTGISGAGPALLSIFRAVTH